MQRPALLFLLLAVATQLVAAEGTIPAAKPVDRYASMLDQSPFALATVVEAPKAPTESFAANWELTGLAKLRDTNGVEKDFVSIRSRDRRISFTLLGEEESNDPDAKGVSVAAVERVDAPRKSTVILRRGTETAKVEFGQETTPQSGQPAGSSPNGGGVSGRQPTLIQPGNIRGIPGQPPGAGAGPVTTYNPNAGINLSIPNGTLQGGLRPLDSGNIPTLPPGMLPQGANVASPSATPRTRMRVIPTR